MSVFFFVILYVKMCYISVYVIIGYEISRNLLELPK